MSFEDIAEQRGLSSAKTRLGELKWDVKNDGYHREKSQPDITFERTMRVMARLALDPALVNRLLDTFADKPLERALVAWDVAHGTLLGREDGELVERIAREIAPLKQLGPRANVAVPRDRVKALIEKAGPDRDPAQLVEDFQTMPSLAAVVAMTASRKILDDKPDLVDVVMAHAKRLAYAHLPSLALAHLQILWDRVAEQKALDLMIEIALDNDMFDAVPALSGDDERTIQRGTYLLVRASLRNYDFVTAAKNLLALHEHPAIRNSKDPSLLVARAELALLAGERPDDASKQAFDSVTAPLSPEPTANWRYAVFVRDAFAIRFEYALPVVPMIQLLSMFGNDARFWGHAAYREDSRAELLELLSREVRYTSHDPEVWRAVSMLVSDGLPIDNELDQRLRSQLDTAFA